MSEFIAKARDRRDRYWTVFGEKSGVEFRSGQIIGFYIAPIYATVELRNGETLDIPASGIEKHLDLASLNWRPDRPRTSRRSAQATSRGHC